MIALRALPILGLLALAACDRGNLDQPPVPLGDFALGLNIALADKAEKLPISREGTVEDWEAAMEKAMADRFDRYDGTRAYNFGISVDGYVLAPVGIPLVLAPKSVLVITANVWDDKTAQKLNFEGKQIMVFEALSEKTVVGSGLTQTSDEQMANLAFQAALAVQDWLEDHPEWFPTDGSDPVPETEPEGTN